MTDQPTLAVHHQFIQIGDVFHRADQITHISIGSIDTPTGYCPAIYFNDPWIVERVAVWVGAQTDVGTVRERAREAAAYFAAMIADASSAPSPTPIVGIIEPDLDHRLPLTGGGGSSHPLSHGGGGVNQDYLSPVWLVGPNVERDQLLARIGEVVAENLDLRGRITNALAILDVAENLGDIADARIALRL